MRISGFSFAKNADTLYYPAVESIRSILPICDEFVIAVGKGSPGDRTREMIAAIHDPKIRVIDTEWENTPKAGTHVFRDQTDTALKACTGDWCFYLQSDEAVHERFLPEIRKRCAELLNDKDVEGFLFSYKHFWGDYRHYHVNHRWYPSEIRIVRNGIGVRSWGDAQSFRIDERKLRVARLDAEIFHYGWVRPPALMQKKTKEMEYAYHSKGSVDTMFAERPPLFDYGPMNRLARFSGTHPEVMGQWIVKMDWKNQLDYEGKSKARFKHDLFKYRLLTFLEQNLLGGRQIGGFRNYTLLKDK
ncbi:MAG: glycosyltransferase [Chitinispirillaceae bacterium]|nr:glycosyltransferase [Chitinispirillaceae bacterium]